MPEIQTITPEETVRYKGLVECSDLYKHLCQWLTKHGYTKNELLNEEQVFEDGKQIKIHQEPFKEISDYAKAELHIDILITDLEEVEIEQDGKTRTIDKGVVEITIETFIITDYEGRWQTKPLYYFIKKIMERFFFGSYLESYKNQIREEKKLFLQEMQKYLNLRRYKFED